MWLYTKLSQNDEFFLNILDRSRSLYPERVLTSRLRGDDKINDEDDEPLTPRHSRAGGSPDDNIIVDYNFPVSFPCRRMSVCQS